MKGQTDPTPGGIPRAGWFTTTHWGTVLAAKGKSASGAREALNALCETYWYPVYAYVRRKGHSSHDAQDLTQEFFARLLSKGFLRDVHPDKGRFRYFLMVCLEHFLAKEWRRARASKRGGDCHMVRIDAQKGEDRYRLEPVDPESPDRLYERRWALLVLEHAMDQLRRECEAGGKGPLFEALQGRLAGTRPEAGTPYAELAGRLGMTESALRTAAKRMRTRYGELLREEIAKTVAVRSEVDAEIQYLFAVLRH